jgi:uncharacterized protein YqgQ
MRGRHSEVVKKHGYLKFLDDRDLVVEMETDEDYDNLSHDLENHLGHQINLEMI